MKNLRRTFTVLFAAAFSMQVLAQREDKLINQDWSFRFSHQVNASAARRVDLPHTWNAQDALGGKHDYKRGIGNYTKKIFIRPEWQGKRLFLRFEGANCVSNVFVNGKHIGEHLRKREGFTRGRSCWVTGGHSAEGCKRFEWMKPVRKGY